MWLLLSRVFVFLCVLRLSECHRLTFNEGGSFKIVQVADVHYGEGEYIYWGPEQDVNSTRVLRNVLRHEHPDLIVYSGDQVTGNNIYNNATAYWAEVVRPAVDHEIPWASIFGNHDDLADGIDGSRTDLMNFDISYPLSRSQFGPADIRGVSNYFLPIYSYECHKASHIAEPPAALLYFLDSGGGIVLDESIGLDQVNWFRNVSTKNHQFYGRSFISSLAFFHIPIEEYMTVYDANKCVGLNEDEVTPVITSNGLFQALSDAGDILATFVGHDHGNGWCCPHNTTSTENNSQISLCFGRHTGYGGYGNWARGARVIELTVNDDGFIEWKSWIRMETGEKIDLYEPAQRHHRNWY